MMKTYKAKTEKEAQRIIDRVVSESKAPFVMGPDYWLNSQFSVAKYYGGMTFNEVHYQIDYDTGDLVRSDCYGLYLKFYKNDRPVIKENEK